MASDEDVLLLVDCLKNVNFSDALRAELVASRFYLDKLSEYTRDETRKSGSQSYHSYTDMKWNAAVSSHFMRLVYSYKTFVISEEFFTTSILRERNIAMENRTDLSDLHGFVHHHGFLDVVNVGDDGLEYMITPNIVVIDSEVMNLVLLYDSKGLLERYHEMFQKNIHDPLHTATSYIGSRHLSKPTAQHQYFQAPVFKYSTPKELQDWAGQLRITIKNGRTYRTGYETWANQIHSSAAVYIHGEEGLISMRDEAKLYLQELRTLKDHMLEANEETGYCNRAIAYLTSIYIAQLSVSLDPEGELMSSLDKDIIALELPAEKPDITELVASMKDFLISPEDDDLFDLAIDTIEALELDSEDSRSVLLAIDILKSEGLDDSTYLSKDDIVRILTKARDNIASSDDDMSEEDVSVYFGVMFFCSSFSREEAFKNDPRTEEIWLKMLRTCDRIFTTEHIDTAAAFRVMDSLGILQDKVEDIPELHGLDAIRYRNLVSVNGLFEGLHTGIDQVNVKEWKPVTGADRITDFKSAQDYSDAVIRAIGKQQIPRSVLALADRDLQESLRHTTVELGIPDYYSLPADEGVHDRQRVSTKHSQKNLEGWGK